MNSVSLTAAKYNLRSQEVISYQEEVQEQLDRQKYLLEAMFNKVVEFARYQADPPMSGPLSETSRSILSE